MNLSLGYKLFAESGIMLIRKIVLVSSCLASFVFFSLSLARGQNPALSQELVGAGAALYADLRCDVCHNTTASGINIPPSLANAGDKFQTPWLEAYLQSPSRRRWVSAGVRPNLRMPNFLLSSDETRALSAFLSTKTDSTHTTELSFVLPLDDSAHVSEGKEIFQEYACYGCHKIAGTGGEVGPGLDGAGRRLRREYLAAFLQNPQAFIPGSPMKVSDLWEEEVQALVAYLMSL